MEDIKEIEGELEREDNTETADKERAVIGAIILGAAPDLADEAFTYLVDRHWEDMPSKLAFPVLKEMYSNKEEINPVTAAEAFRRAKLGGASLRVKFFTDYVDWADKPQEYINIFRWDALSEKIKRKIRNLQEQEDTPTEADIEAVIDLVHERDMIGHSSVIGPADGLEEYIKSLTEKRLLSINTGFPALDHNLHAQPGDLVIVGARTGIGKTTFLTNTLYNISRKSIPCLYIPTEMDANQFRSRIFPLMTGVYASRFRSMKFKEGQLEEIKTAAEEYKQLPIYTLDIASPTIGEIRAAVKEKSCKVLFVDYLGRCSMTREATRMREIEKFVVALKTFCVNQGIVCFMAVQLSRLTDRNADTAPLLADLSDSSAIEKEADLVLMLWKDPKKELTGDYSSAIITATIEKNRHGFVDTFDICFDKNKMQMTEQILRPAITTRRDYMAGED